MKNKCSSDEPRVQVSITPMMAQWQSCKVKAKDALLLFRLGDFYEAFHDDAQKISKELGLTLTQRQNVPMCGVPCHSHEQYVDKLISLGHKVAIAEQIEDSQSTKGLVRREISRVFTPGTVVDSRLLEEKKNNFIASLAQIGSIFALAYLDLTTGEFFALEVEKESDLLNELHRVRPSELLASRKFLAAHPHFFPDLSNALSFLLNTRDDWQFDHQTAHQALLNHFHTASLDGFGLKGRNIAIAAAGSLLIYLKDDLALRLNHVASLRMQAISHYMAIDHTTLRHLELTRTLNDESRRNTLLDLIDHTATSMGARRLCQWLTRPLVDKTEILRRQDAIADFLAHPDSSRRLHQFFSAIRDLERLIAKISARYASPRDLWTLGRSLCVIDSIRDELACFSSVLIQGARSQLYDVSVIASKICQSITENPPLRISDGELFRAGVHEELDYLRRLTRDAAGWIAEYQTGLREKTGIKTLKVGFTRAFGYYIEVSRAKGGVIPADFQRSQTLVSSERYVTEELKKHEHHVLTAGERVKALEMELFEKLRAETACESESITAIARAIAEIDALLSLALTASQHHFNRPTVDETNCLQIRNGRHPVLERAIGSAHFIANDTLMDESRQLILLTGPNMAGKSTYIRQVALIVILAQMGSYVPADSAHIGLVDKLFSRIGASDDLARGQSTFMVEMSETANILRNATSRSLIILDEIGRGTSTYDGISIAWAVAGFLLTTAGQQAKTLFATHYWELTQLEQQYCRVVNMHVAVQETPDGIVFLRKIVPGGTDRSYGIHVARLAGMPHAVVQQAREMLAHLEKTRQPQALLSPSPSSSSGSSSARKKRLDAQLLLFPDSHHFSV
jgi:DNA mismatch repair protein MutS